MALNKNAGHPRNESSIDSCVIECSLKVIACGRDVARPGRANNDPRLSTLRYHMISALEHLENCLRRTNRVGASRRLEGPDSCLASFVPVELDLSLYSWIG
jgi:hypothetical protein